MRQTFFLKPIRFDFVESHTDLSLFSPHISCRESFELYEKDPTGLKDFCVSAEA